MNMTYPYDLPQLKISFSALEPKTSKWTFETHYTKNHAGYVKKLNALLQKRPDLQAMSLTDLIANSAGAIFDNASQHWNHSFLWQNIQGAQPLPTVPSEPVMKLLLRSFGSFEKFQQTFIKIGLQQFGSGWVWLSVDEKKALKIETTPDADNPLFYGRIPVLICDVWEHAYFCDYQTNRKGYLEGFFSYINWAMVEQRLFKGDPLYGFSS